MASTNGLVHLWHEEPYRKLFQIPAFGKVSAALFGDPDIWFINEQVTWKQGGSKRTPFHQCPPSAPMAQI